MFTWTPDVTAAREYDSIYPVAFTFDDEKETYFRTSNIIVANVPLPPKIALGLSFVKESEYEGNVEAGGLAYGKIARYGNYLIVTNAEAQESFGEDVADLKIFDVTEPGNLVHKMDYFASPGGVEYIETGYGQTGYGDEEMGYRAYTYDMAIRGNLLYLYRGLRVALDPDWNTYDDYCELKILDISDIENENIVDTAYYRFNVDSGWRQNGFISDGRVVVLDPEGGYNDLKIMDVRDPENTSEALLEQFTYEESQSLNGVFIEQDKAYVVSGEISGPYDYRIDVFDIRDMDNGNTSRINTYEFRAYDTKGIYVENGYLYIGLDILRAISLTPVASYHTGPGDNIKSFTRMIVDGSIIYLSVEGTAIDNSEDGIITLNQENLLVGLGSGLLRKNDDLRLNDNAGFKSESTTPYVGIYYDKENILLYGLRQKTSDPECVYVDLIRTSLVRDPYDSELASYKFNQNQYIEFRTVIEDPDGEPEPLTVWIKDLPDYLDYEFDGISTLTITEKDSPTEGVYDFVIYADDGLNEVSQPVRIEIISDTFSDIKDVKEIQRLVDEAEPETIVYIEPGIYRFIEPVTQHIFDHGKLRVYSRDLIINKDITLKAIDPDPDNTVIDLAGDFSHSISIMDPNYYQGSHRYSTTGFDNVNDVTIEGITIDGECRGRETVEIWVVDEVIQTEYGETGYGQTGYGYKEIGHWATVTSANVKSPIYNFSQGLTLRDCNILSTNRNDGSIYTWRDTELILEDTYVEGDIVRERTSIPPPPPPPPI
jgi:hypothetical protein